jgi:hypothetical protein
MSQTSAKASFLDLANDVTAAFAWCKSLRSSGSYLNRMLTPSESCASLRIVQTIMGLKAHPLRRLRLVNAASLRGLTFPRTDLLAAKESVQVKYM